MEQQPLTNTLCSFVVYICARKDALKNKDHGAENSKGNHGIKIALFCGTIKLRGERGTQGRERQRHSIILTRTRDTCSGDLGICMIEHTYARTHTYACAHLYACVKSTRD